MKIAFLTAGGIAPCLSSSIGALIEQYAKSKPDAEMIGYLNGYRGLLLGQSIEFPASIKENFATLYEYGGSPIGNSRVKLTNIQDCIDREQKFGVNLFLKISSLCLLLRGNILGRLLQ